MRDSPIDVLLIEDDEDDYLLTRALLGESEDARFSLNWIRTARDGLAALLEGHSDVALLDHRLGMDTGLDVLAKAMAQGCRIPIIMLTGNNDRALDLQAMERGATDFLQKGHFSARLLERAIRYAIERRRAEVQTLALTLEQERSEILAEFIRDALHEFRTPLTNIRSSLFMVTNARNDEERGKYSERIDAQVDLISSLVETLALMTELDSITVLALEAVNLAHVLDVLCEQYRTLAAAKSVHVSLKREDRLPRVHGDEQRLIITLRKVLDNAVRYTPAGGSVEIWAGRQDGALLIRVQDSGLGIAPEKLPRIFERFYREDNAHSTPGFGLGLPIAKAIIDAHQGRIEVESVSGQGSIFTLILPLSDPA